VPHKGIRGTGVLYRNLVFVNAEQTLVVVEL